MLTFGVSVEGVTADALARAASILRPALLKITRSAMYRARGRMAKLASGPVLKARPSGPPRLAQRGRVPTATALRRAKVSAALTADGVIGRLRHGARLLNIHEGGASVPAARMALKPDGRSAFRFSPSQYGSGFARGTLTRGAFRLPARPIAGPVLEGLIPDLQAALAAKAADILEGHKHASG